MYIAYYDEAGDDGFPKYSSPLFVLTAVYLHYSCWKDVFEKIRQFRKKLKIDYNIPIKTEFHTKNFALNKNPYRALKISENDKAVILKLFVN